MPLVNGVMINMGVPIGRGPMMLQNLGPDTLYVGEEGLTTTNGFQVEAGKAIVIAPTEYDIWAMSSGGSHVRTLGRGVGIFDAPGTPPTATATA